MNNQTVLSDEERMRASSDEEAMSMAFFLSLYDFSFLMMLHHTCCSNFKIHGCMLLLQCTLIGQDQAWTGGKRIRRHDMDRNRKIARRTREGRETGTL